MTRASKSLESGVSGPESGVHRELADLQKRTAFLPDYGLRATEAESASSEHAGVEVEPWPAVNVGTSVSGIVGGLMTLVVACLAALALKSHAIR